MMFSLSACATTSNAVPEGDQASDVQVVDSFYGTEDPLEPINRAVFGFNAVLDDWIIRPVTVGYDYVTPTLVQNGVSNFFQNLFEPTTIVNDLLQGQVADAGRDTGRFLINSTIGLLGFLDVAKHLDLPPNDEDFGQTLAVWGVPTGPYLVLPFLGPSTVRDSVGRIGDFYVYAPISAIDNPEQVYVRALSLIDLRHSLLPFDDAYQAQPDQYAFLRDLYLQNRLQNSLGEAALQPYLDAAEDELLDDLLD